MLLLMNNTLLLGGYNCYIKQILLCQYLGLFHSYTIITAIFSMINSDNYWWLRYIDIQFVFETLTILWLILLLLSMWHSCCYSFVFLLSQYLDRLFVISNTVAHYEKDCVLANYIAELSPK